MAAEECSFPRGARRRRRHDADAVSAVSNPRADEGPRPMSNPTDPTALLLLIAGSALDPAPIIAEQREQDPVCWLPGFDLWFVTRHEDVRLLFADPRLTSDPRAHAGY